MAFAKHFSVSQRSQTAFDALYARILTLSHSNFPKIYRDTENTQAQRQRFESIFFQYLERLESLNEENPNPKYPNARLLLLLTNSKDESFGLARERDDAYTKNYSQFPISKDGEMTTEFSNLAASFERLFARLHDLGLEAQTYLAENPNDESMQLLFEKSFKFIKHACNFHHDAIRRYIRKANSMHAFKAVCRFKKIELQILNLFILHSTHAPESETPSQEDYTVDLANAYDALSNFYILQKCTLQEKDPARLELLVLAILAAKRAVYSITPYHQNYTKHLLRLASAYEAFGAGAEHYEGRFQQAFDSFVKAIDLFLENNLPRQDAQNDPLMFAAKNLGFSLIRKISDRMNPSSVYDCYSSILTVIKKLDEILLQKEKLLLDENKEKELLRLKIRIIYSYLLHHEPGNFNTWVDYIWPVICEHGTERDRLLNARLFANLFNKYSESNSSFYESGEYFQKIVTDIDMQLAQAGLLHVRKRKADEDSNRDGINPNPNEGAPPFQRARHYR